MRTTLFEHVRKSGVFPLLVVLTLVIISSSFAGAFVTDAPHLLNETVKAGVHGSSNRGIASAYENNPAVNLSAGETSGILPNSQGVGGAPSYANRSIWLGDFNGSYLQPVYIPVYSSDIGSFNILNQTFSYDPQILSFNGTLNDVASQDVNFSYTIPVQGILKVYGNGSFNAEYSRTVLYCLVFNSVIKNQTITSVLLDFSTIGSSNISLASQATVRLSRGWTNLGPKNFSSYDPYTQSNTSGQVFLSGTVPAIGYSPYNLSILYAASGRGGPWQGNLYQGEDVNGFGGVFKSSDAGKSWYPVDNGLNSTEVNAIAVNPKNPNMVVIATGGIASIVGGGIYKTTNGGKSWQETYGMGGNFITFYEGKLYAASFHAILISNDFGSSWKVVHYFPDIVTTMDVSNGGNTIFVGLYQGGQFGQVSISKSTNAGLNFYSVLNETGYYSVSQIQTDPSNSSRMMALIEHAYTTYPNLFNSSDAGLTWNAINDSKVGISYTVYYGSGFQNGYVAEVPQAFTYDSMNGSVIYVVGPSGTYKSTDGGSHFELLVTGGTSNDSQGSGGDIRMISVDPASDNIIFIGSDQGLSVSKDAGYTWTLLNNRSATMVYTVAASGSYVFTTVQDWSAEFSNDYGRSWYSAQGSEEGWASVDPYNSSIAIILGGDSFIVVSNDGGRSFFYPRVNNSSDFGDTSKNVVGIVYAQNGTIFAAGNGGIFKSSNDGRSWDIISGSPPGDIAIALDPINQNVLYASSYSSSTNGSGLYKSIDGGLSWNIVNNQYFNSISVDPYNDSIVVGATYPGDYYGGLEISYNGGITFNDMNFNSTDIFVASPQVFFHQQDGKTFLIYTTDQGIFYSTDLGKSWLNVTYNIPSFVISDLFISNNGSAYVSTYGMGVWYDPNLFNSSSNQNNPILTGYVSRNTHLTINGNNIAQERYFILSLHVGLNVLEVGNLSQKLYLNASRGSVYFENFSNPLSEVRINETGLPSLTNLHIAIGTNEYVVKNGSSIFVSPGIYNYSVYQLGTDYSLFVPVNGTDPLNATDLLQSLNVRFQTVYDSSSYNITSQVQNGLLTTQIAYNKGYVMFGGGGKAALMNVTSGAVESLYDTPPLALFDSIISYNQGFLLGGLYSANHPGIYYYNISKGAFYNYSTLLPSQWNASSAQIHSVFGINNYMFGFIGGATGQTYFGIIDNGTFKNLTGYLPSYFMSPPGWLDSFSASYLSHYDAAVISDGSRVGIFYLQNNTYQDISGIMPPPGFSVGIGFTFVISHAFITSNGTAAMIIGGYLEHPFVGIYSPESGFKDVSYLVPPNEYPYSVTCDGNNFIISLLSEDSLSPSIIIFNSTTNKSNTLGTLEFGNFSTIDSAILANNTLFFTTFNVKTVPNETYFIYQSYYGVVKLTPTGCINVKVNTPSSIEINNESYYAMNATIPLFAGNYTLTVSSPGLVGYTATVDLLPFETRYLNVTLAPKSYGITFIENGLTNSTSWSVTLNGTTKSSSSSNITFLVPNGTYSYSIAPISGYTILSMPGYNETTGSLTVNGYNLSYPVTFLHNNEGYFVVTVYPVNATLYINGTAYQRTGILVSTPAGNNGGGAVEFFNISLAPGTYQVKITATGYHTYTTTITMSSQLTPIYRNYTLEEISSHSSFPLLYAAFAAVIVVIVAITTVILLRRRGRKK